MEAMEEVLPPLEQQLEDALAPLHGLVMHIVMISITTWTATMMAETVADVMLTQTGAQYAHALIQMEAGVEQLAHLLQQQPITQVLNIKLSPNWKKRCKNDCCKHFS